MDVLQVTTVGATPPLHAGGPRRIDGLVRARRPDDTVKRWSEVSLSVDQPSEPLEIEEGYYEYRFCSLPHVVADTVTGQFDAPQVYTYRTTSISKTPYLDEWLETADVILVELPYQFRYIYERKPAETPVVYSSHNVETDRLAWLDDGFLPKRFYNRIRRQERFAVENADSVVVCSDRDAALYRDYFDPDAPLVTLPNAADLSTVRANSDDGSIPRGDPASNIPEDALVCGFVGAEYEPNVTAVEHIIEISNQPAIVDSDIHFLVVGTVGDAFTDRNVGNVHFTGFVEDLRPWYAMCDVALNPMTEGGGSNVKIPEYLAHGLPVVTTPFGARGFALDESTFATVVPLEAFPEVLLDVDPAETMQTGQTAKQHVLSTLNWESVSSHLWDRFDDLAN